MIDKTPESITIDCTTGTIDENAPAEVSAQYVRADVAHAWVAERDAEIARLIALQETWSREVNRLREMHGKACEIAAEYRQRAETPRTDAEWKAADRRKRMIDMRATSAITNGPIYRVAGFPDWKERALSDADALSRAIVEAEE